VTEPVPPSGPVVLELIAARRVTAGYTTEDDALRTALAALCLAADRLLAEFHGGVGGPRITDLRAAVDRARTILNPPTTEAPGR
jgi:hypothetical protein